MKPGEPHALIQKAIRAAKHTRSLTVLPMADMRRLCLYAAVADELLTDIEEVCRASTEQNIAIRPHSLLAHITENRARFFHSLEAPKESPTS